MDIVFLLIYRTSKNCAQLLALFVSKRGGKDIFSYHRILKIDYYFLNFFLHARLQVKNTKLIIRLIAFIGVKNITRYYKSF